MLFTEKGEAVCSFYKVTNQPIAWQEKLTPTGSQKMSLLGISYLKVKKS